MDVKGVICELRRELDQIDRAVRALETALLDSRAKAGTLTSGKLVPIRKRTRFPAYKAAISATNLD